MSHTMKTVEEIAEIIPGKAAHPIYNLAPSPSRQDDTLMGNILARAKMFQGQVLVKTSAVTCPSDVGQLYCDSCGVQIGESYIEVEDIGPRPTDIEEQHYIADSWLTCGEQCADKLITDNAFKVG